jgi:hypothetical protein
MDLCYLSGEFSFSPLELAKFAFVILQTAASGFPVASAESFAAFSVGYFRFSP